jgi:MFS family permease
MFKYLLSIVKLDRDVLRFCFAWAMIGLIVLGINAVLMNLYVLNLGFDFTFLGNLNGSGQIVWVFAALPAGFIGTRFGLRNSLIAGYVVVILALASFLSVAWLPRSVWATGLFLSNGVIGIGAALILVNAVPYLMAIASKNDRNLAFTFMSALFALMAFVGSLAAGILPGFLISLFAGRLTEAAAYNAVMWLAIPAYLGSVLLLLKSRPDPPVLKETKTVSREAAPIGMLIFLGILFVVQLGSENALQMFLNVYLADDLFVSDTLIGSIFAVARLLPFFLSPLLPFALKRWGSGLTMSVGYLFISACAVLIALIPSVGVAAVGFILFNMAASFNGTARNLFGQESVLPRWRTSVTAVFTIAMAAGGSIVGFGAGRLIELAGFRGIFLSSAILALLGVLLYSGRQRLGRKQPPPIQPEVISDDGSSLTGQNL